MANENNKMTFDLSVVTSGMSEARNNFKEINTAFRDMGKYLEQIAKKNGEVFDQKLFEKSLANIKELNKFNQERLKNLEKESKLQESINELNKAFFIAKNAGDTKTADKAKETIKYLEAQKNLIGKRFEQERLLYKEQDEREKAQDRRSKEQKSFNNFWNKGRDEFREKGLFAGLKAISPSKALSTSLNTQVELNDEEISENNEKIKEIEKEMLGTVKGTQGYAKLQAQKDELQSKNIGLLSKNRQITMAQGLSKTLGNAVKGFGKLAGTIFKTMGIDLKSIMSDVISNITRELSDKTGIATFATGSTLFTNSSAREQQMKYGLSNSANYALTRTMELLNMSSDDDLMYMNQSQKEIFNNLMDKYKTWYTNLESTGAMVKLQEAQLEFKMFKQELSMKLLNWFAEHKEAIFALLEIMMNVLEFIANVVEGILNFFGKNVKSSSSAIASSASSSTNNTSNININVNNTNNASANLNNKAELDASLNTANSNLVKQIAASLVGQ